LRGPVPYPNHFACKESGIRVPHLQSPKEPVVAGFFIPLDGSESESQEVGCNLRMQPKPDLPSVPFCFPRKPVSSRSPRVRDLSSKWITSHGWLLWIASKNAWLIASGVDPGHGRVLAPSDNFRFSTSNRRSFRTPFRRRPVKITADNWGRRRGGWWFPVVAWGAPEEADCQKVHKSQSG